jgi:hypothetical protein
MDAASASASEVEADADADAAARTNETRACEQAILCYMTTPINDCVPSSLSTLSTLSTLPMSVQWMLAARLRRLVFCQEQADAVDRTKTMQTFIWSRSSVASSSGDNLDFFDATATAADADIRTYHICVRGKRHGQTASNTLQGILNDDANGKQDVETLVRAAQRARDVALGAMHVPAVNAFVETREKRAAVALAAAAEAAMVHSGWGGCVPTERVKSVHEDTHGIAADTHVDMYRKSLSLEELQNVLELARAIPSRTRSRTLTDAVVLARKIRLGFLGGSAPVLQPAIVLQKHKKTALQKRRRQSSASPDVSCFCLPAETTATAETTNSGDLVGASTAKRLADVRAVARAVALLNCVSADAPLDLSTHASPFYYLHNHHYYRFPISVLVSDAAAAAAAAAEAVVPLVSQPKPELASPISVVDASIVSEPALASPIPVVEPEPEPVPPIPIEPVLRIESLPAATLVQHSAHEAIHRHLRTCENETMPLSSPRLSAALSRVRWNKTFDMRENPLHVLAFACETEKAYSYSYSRTSVFFRAAAAAKLVEDAEAEARAERAKQPQPRRAVHASPLSPQHRVPCKTEPWYLSFICTQSMYAMMGRSIPGAAAVAAVVAAAADL